MIFLEGKQAADSIKERLRVSVAEFKNPPRLAVIIVGENTISKKFVALKESFAKDIGIDTRKYFFEESITTSKLRNRMKDIVHEDANDGVIVQLPLPASIDVQSILNSITPEKDVDVLSARSVGDFQVGKNKIMPPTVAALKTLFEQYEIPHTGKRVVVLGYGRLVGQPIASWITREGSSVTVVSGEQQFDPLILKSADIVISGIGKPGFVRGEHIKDGAVVIDLGTSEAEGKIVGDIDQDSVSKKAAYLTPPSGGIGPLTVAAVFENLLTLTKIRRG